MNYIYLYFALMECECYLSNAGTTKIIKCELYWVKMRNQTEYQFFSFVFFVIGVSSYFFSDGKMVIDFNPLISPHPMAICQGCHFLLNLCQVFWERSVSWKQNLSLIGQKIWPIHEMFLLFFSRYSKTSI